MCVLCALSCAIEFIVNILGVKILSALIFLLAGILCIAFLFFIVEVEVLRDKTKKIENDLTELKNKFNEK
jgi:hypothetical protein